MRSVAIVGTEGQLGRRLAARYTELGDGIRGVALRPGASLESVAAELGDAPIDVLIFADDESPPHRHAASVARAELQTGLDRLSYAPFRLAILLRSALAADGGGKLVLLSRTAAAMEHRDHDGRYLERPFRAAAHALWRCLSIEWRAFGIECLVVALDDPADADAISRLPQTIAEAHSGDEGVRLVDSHGRVLAW
jgi:NAD(P)-dependent dehydrogenase (short-subunit alcohol dehydrogenase family)